MLPSLGDWSSARGPDFPRARPQRHVLRRYALAVRPFSDRHDVAIGVAFAAGAAILYGAAYPATAVALRSFTPLGVAALACTMALPVLLLLAAGGVLPRPALRSLTWSGALRLTILALLGGFAFIAATNTAVALSGPTITGFVAPLYAVAAAVLAVPILGEPLRPTTVAAFALALVGTVLLAGFEPASTTWPGVVLAVVAAVMFGLYIVLSRRWARPYGLDGTLVTIANLVSRGPILLVIEWFRSPTTLIPDQVDPAALIALLTIAFGSSSTANLFLMASVRRVPARRTSAALLLTPVASAVIGIAWLGERLTPIETVGAIVVLVGIAGASGVVERLAQRTIRAA